jgi:hypothetical protein
MTRDHYTSTRLPYTRIALARLLILLGCLVAPKETKLALLKVMDGQAALKGYGLQLRPVKQDG